MNALGLCLKAGTLTWAGTKLLFTVRGFSVFRCAPISHSLCLDGTPVALG